MAPRVLIGFLVLVMTASTARAQESLTIDSVYLGSAACRLRSGAGSPEGVVTGNVCDIYVRTDTVLVYRKRTGTGNTGWVADGDVTIGGTGVATITTNGVVYGNGTSAVGVTAQGPANSVLTANAGAPSFSDTPTVTSLTATTLTANTSLTTPSLLAAANLSIAPTGDVTLNPTGNDILPVTNFDLNLGSSSAKFLTLHAAELWVENLVAQDVMATIGGRVIVAPTTELVQDLTNVATTIHVKHNQIANGDRILLMTSVGGTAQVEWLAVTSAASGSSPDFSYTVTRNLDGSGANTWPAGSAVMNSGTTGDGYIDLYSTSGVFSGTGPTIVGNVRTGTTYNQVSPRWAIGNLNGLYGYASDEYGAAFGNPSAAWVKIDPTNGVRIGHNTTTKIQLDAAGAASFSSGELTIDANGVGLNVAPSVTFDLSNAYAFTTSSHRMGMFGYSASGVRGIKVLSENTGGAAQNARIDISVSGDTGGLQDASLQLDSPGTGATTTTATLSAATVNIGSNFDVTGSTVRVHAGGIARSSVNTSTGDTTVLGDLAVTGADLSGLNTITSAGAGATQLTLTASTFNVAATIAIGAGQNYSFSGDSDTFIDNDSANRIRFSAGATRIFWDGTQFFPENDGTKNLGHPSFRWGTVYAAVGTINTSDARLKRDVHDTAYGRDFLLALRPVDFRWKDARVGAGVYQGFLAQDVAAIAPAFGGLSFDADGIASGLNYSAFIGPLVAGYQELEARVRALEGRR
jgi:hypothetical protein